MSVESLSNSFAATSIDNTQKELKTTELETKPSIPSNLKVLAGDFESSSLSKYELLQALILSSQSLETSRIMYDMLLNDTQTFVKGLEYINDSRGILLINIIPTKTTSQLLESLVNAIKNLVKQKIKEKDSTGLYFYLSLYLGVISNFEIFSNQLLTIFLSLVNPLVYTKAEEISTLVLLVTIKHINSDKNSTIEVIRDYLELINDDDSPSISEVVNFVKILELYFAILPEVIAPIYMNDATKRVILEQVKNNNSTIEDQNIKSSEIRNSTQPSLVYPNQNILILGILKLISSSCINDQCRTFNATNFINLLKFGSTLENLEMKLFSTLAFIKIWNFVKLDNKNEIEKLVDSLVHYIKETEHEVELLDVAIEGLAYLSLNIAAKIKLREDVTFIESIMKILKSRTTIADSEASSKLETLPTSVSTSSVYGMLLILSNLSKLKDPTQTEKSTLKSLKSHATPGNDKTDEDQQVIHLFNKSLLVDYKIMEVISKLKTYKDETKGSNLITQSLQLIYQISMNPDKSVRQELVKQGALNIILNFLIQNSQVKSDKTTNMATRPSNFSESLVDIRILTLRSLANILISINPQLAFKKYDIKTPVPFLVELLGPDISNYTGINSQTDPDTQYLYDMTNLDKYESLLALTNLSSYDSSDLKKLIISKTFDIYLNNFIIDSDNQYIQKAAWELISNLIIEPSLLVKFFNVEGSPENFNRLKLLVKLLNSQDESFQIVLAGLLANASSEFEMIAQILVKNEIIRDKLTEIIGDIFTNQAKNSDLIHRTCFILLNMVYAAAEIPELIGWFRKNSSLKTSMNHIVRNCKDQQVLEILMEILKVVRFEI